MARKFATGIDLMNQKVVNLADGSSATDAVTLQQLQAAIRGLDWKESVRAASTANLTLSGTQTVDGVALIAGDRILVKDQTSADDNGIYLVAAGAWTRTVDADSSDDVTSGMATTVTEGTVNGDKSFILITNGPIVLDTTSLVFTQLGGSGTAYTAGNGLQLSGSSFSILLDSSPGLLVTGAGVKIDPDYSGLAKRFASNVPSGSTSAAVTHSLGTKDVIVAVYDIASDELIECDVVRTSTTVVTLGFAVAPTTDQYRVVVLG